MTPAIADVGAPNCAELNLVAGDQQMVGDVGKHVLYTTITSKTTANNGVSASVLLEQMFNSAVLANTLSAQS